MLGPKDNKSISKNKTEGNGNVNIQNSNIKINKGMDEVLELAREGDNIGALRKMGMLQRCFGAMHPLYPDFRYSLNMNEKGVSIKVVGNNEEAIKKYPPHGNIKFIIPDEYKWAKNINELIVYGYENQIPIKLKAEGIKLWLGEYLMEEFKSVSEVNIITKKFPQPIPMKFEFQNTSFKLDYLEMGLVRIENDYLILSNEMQEGAKLILSLSINRSNISDDRLNIKVSEKYIDNVEVNLKMNKFLSNIGQEGVKKLVVLKDDSEFMVFSDSNINYTNIRGIEKEIGLLERLYVLEKYYGVVFTLPEKITEDDCENLLVLEKSMNNKPITGTYSKLTVSLTVNSNFNQIEAINKDIGQNVECVFIGEKVEIFGQSIVFKEKKINYYNAVVDNKEKTLKKFEFADDCDVLNVKFIPLDKINNSFEVYYKFK
ncbi:hypothetical protein K9O30_06080 [Clostridium bowmanii]|uniref:hypothetical protein n=1 Tax=Clostridium bowmanii TaxID=132925 RepID=UPI001C0C1B81|nr:hypothetical protein [Clostridium bowmanii]MBU3188728.1 hypothetical protein [Clostridium bowmanii]MCA1073313.1 hypothetical protein [Clostridium bowmanii]